MNIDETTGLPELPEGYFWRIKKFIAPYARVEIRRADKFFSTLIESGVLYRAETGDHKKIVDTAQFALKKWNEYRGLSARESVYGDYPPKKLEV
jgi:hypothetical protein